MKKILLVLGVIAFVFFGINVKRRYDRITAPNVPVAVREEIELKVIEGWTLGEISNMLTANGVTSTAFLAEAGEPLDDQAMAAHWREAYSFLDALPHNATLEGYLFPDTYRVWKDALPNSLIKKQLDEFATKADVMAAGAKGQKRTLKDVVTLASIVQEEVRDDADMPVVAGIFMNRLKIGMALQSDATINYITKSGRARSTAKDLSIDSPYNTYKYPGLPPGPVSNPGDAALQAALHPAKTPYLYFLTGKDGKVYYARTLDEHIANKRRAF